ncbi:hypothetical protein J6590_034753 [Homalodisca vitripennis]|nr:hypothetical protein J6590_034753 [Homalodisca vitripennis]
MVFEPEPVRRGSPSRPYLHFSRAYRVCGARSLCELLCIEQISTSIGIPEVKSGRLSKLARVRSGRPSTFGDQTPLDGIVSDLGFTRLHEKLNCPVEIFRLIREPVTKSD